MASVLAFLLIMSLLPELSGGKAYAASGYTIHTVAGMGNAGYLGDGEAATSAQLNYPSGVAVDSTGNLYIADTSNHRIRKVDASGKISTIAGTGTGGYSGDGGLATKASLKNPYGVAIDSIGNLYISDYSNHSIRKIDVSGIISTVAGTGSYGYSGDGGRATSALLRDPDGVAVDSSGNLYIADKGNHRIRKVDVTGKISTVAGMGTAGYLGDGEAATSAQLNNPTGVTVDGSGNLYIADRSNFRIRKVDTTGKISTIAGTDRQGYSGDGGPAISAVLNGPTGVAVDSIGNLYISDASNSRVRKVDTSGKISTIAGTGQHKYSGDGGPATSADLSGPYGMAIDSSGNLYIADVINNRIRKLSEQTVVAFAASSIPEVGVDDTITLTVKNALGNTDTSFNGVHDVTISGYLQAPDHSYGSLNGTALSASSSTVSVTFASGVATVNLRLNKAGAQTINISVADVASPAANELIIMPEAGSAASMALTTDIKAPANNGGTFAQQPVVMLFDAYGNTSAGDNRTIVTASKKDWGAWALTGTTTAKASAGVVTFSGLGATNTIMVTGAKLSFETENLPPVESTTVTLPIYTGKLITQLRPVPHDLDHPHGGDDSSKFKKIDSKVYLTNEPYADLLFTTKSADGLSVFVDDIRKGIAARGPSGNLVVRAGADSLKIDSADPLMDTSMFRLASQPVPATGIRIDISANKATGDDLESVVLLQAPTVISLDVPDILETGKTITINGNVDTKARLPITITTIQETINDYTDAQGQFTFVYTAPLSAVNEFIIVEAPGVEQQLVKSWPVTIYKPITNILPAPSGLKATAGDGEVVLTWGPVAGATYYGIYEGYASGSYQKIATITNDSGSFSLKGLPNNITRYYVVKAGNDEIESDYSEEVIATPRALPPSGPHWPDGSELTASDITQTSLKLSWPTATNNVGVIGYRIYVDGIEHETVSGSVNATTIEGLGGDTTYTFKVTAFDEEGNESETLTVSARTLPQPPDPDTEAPQWRDGSELTASDITQTSLKLSWPTATDNVGVTGYRIYVNGTERETVNGSVYATTIEGLRADTTYTFKVTAFNEEGNESKALTVSAKTLPQPPEPDTEAPTWPEDSVLTISDITQTSMKLIWPAAQDDVAVIGYRLYVNDEKKVDQVSSKYEYSVTDNVYSYTMTGLAPGTSYPITVKAYDAANNEGNPGLSKTARTLPRSSSGGGNSGGSSGGGWYLSSNNNLKTLEIWTEDKRVSLKPSFSVNNYMYEVETEAKQIELKASTDHASAKVTWQGQALDKGIQIDLQEGENVISMIVQAEDGSRKTYTLTINRKKPKPEELEPLVISFTDISTNWAVKDIMRAAAKGIVSGYPDGGFKPNNPVTRAEFTVMLAGALKLEGEVSSLTFADNDQIGGWAKKSVTQVVQAGIVNGYVDGSFRPNAYITRAEMATMIARALKPQLNAHALTGFADDEAIPQWAKGAIEAIRSIGIVDGRSWNYFVPNETATRVEATVMLLRMLEQQEKE